MYLWAIIIRRFCDTLPDAPTVGVLITDQ
jgi:hypothetical protein